MLTAAEVAKELRVGVRRVWQLCAIGAVPSVRLGGRVMIPKEAFEAWQRQQVRQALARCNEWQAAHARAS
jgi:excisionase family DNA binding protein